MPSKYLGVESETDRRPPCLPLEVIRIRMYAMSCGIAAERIVARSVPDENLWFV